MIGATLVLAGCSSPVWYSGCEADSRTAFTSRTYFVDDSRPIVIAGGNVVFFGARDRPGVGDGRAPAGLVVLSGAEVQFSGACAAPIYGPTVSGGAE